MEALNQTFLNLSHYLKQFIQAPKYYQKTSITTLKLITLFSYLFIQTPINMLFTNAKYYIKS